jgi:transcriptional regulator with XRE-family HTH domain
MTPTQDGPVSRRRLRARLRQARNERELTQSKVADAMDWSLSKLIRIESGLVGISSSDLKVLLQHYGIDDPAQVDEFLDLARASRREQTGWWVAYRGVAPPQYLTFIGYENSAQVIQAFQPLVVPGLLQEEEYARHVIRAQGTSGDVLNELVKLRMQRQRELFERSDPPEMIFVIDEASLHRWVGGREAMRQQLKRLRKEIARPNVTIEIIPFEAGEHRGLNGSSFVILQFAETEDDDVLFLENSRGDVISRDEQTAVDPYQNIFDELRVLANREEPQAVIDRVLEKM